MVVENAHNKIVVTDTHKISRIKHCNVFRRLEQKVQSHIYKKEKSGR